MPFFVRPTVFPLDAWLAVQNDQKTKVLCTEAHPFQLALRWRQEIATDSTLTKARIGVREGLSRARVTQIMNLLQLPEAIQRQLQNPPSPFDIHAFSERRLRVLPAESNKSKRLRNWKQWLTELL